ncbi:hypothetical protein JX266_014233 [Neoarthrinium moseri]|nr:hypothetical protein JX266_014233 [Neoarthrinium moseri]
MYKLLVNTSMSLGNQRTPNRSNTVTDHYSTSTATSLDTERTGARVARCADDAQGKVITTETARQQTRSAYYAVAHTSPPAGSAEGTKHKKDRQRNHVGANEARKLDENATDDSTRQEVGSWSDTLDQHEIDVTQVPVRNPNVTAALASHSTDYLYIGDFNLHDQVWGGDGVFPARQGEADHLIDMMNELGLMSLLPRGMKTWQRDGHERTTDLVLASEGLANDTIACGTHPTEHGSDHRAIETIFGTRMPLKNAENRLLLRNVL